jgi:hypothetical protein
MWQAVESGKLIEQSISLVQATRALEGWEMLVHARRHASRILAVVAGVCLVAGYDAKSQTASQLPPAAEPSLAQQGDWAADFNQAQIACYEGSMKACDAIWLNDRVLLDSWLGQYGRTCGGRADLRAIRRANLSCTEAFPVHE